jgi:DNA-directed RNA polymerase subunit omega
MTFDALYRQLSRFQSIKDDAPMARTTNSDTLKYVNNKYELNLLAAQRVRDLNAGISSVLPESDDKNTVRALREIASGKLDVEILRKELVQSYKNDFVSGEFVESEETVEGANSEELQMLEQFDQELAGVVPDEEVAGIVGGEVEKQEEAANADQPVAE